MSAQILDFQYAWRRWLNAARVALSFGCLGEEFISSRFELTGVAGAAGLFGVYAVTALFVRRASEEKAVMLLCLFADTLFFLVFAGYGADPGAWLASIFYCYLLLSAVVIHNWADVFIVAGVCIVFFGLMRSAEKEMVRRLVYFGGLLACALAFQKRKLQERLEAVASSERKLREEATSASATERERIAADFHDGPLQNVISIQIRLEILRRLLERDRAEGIKELRQLQELAKSVVGELRSFLRTMRPPPVAGTDLTASLRRVIEDFQKDSGIPVRFENAEAPITAPVETSVEVLQILREALMNVQKHAKARRVAVSVEKVGRNLELEVDDNGAGFPFSGSFGLEELEALRLGPRSIARRVRGLGGELLIESRPGHGAGLKIRVPA